MPTLIMVEVLEGLQPGEKSDMTDIADEIYERGDKGEEIDPSALRGTSLKGSSSALYINYSNMKNNPPLGGQGAG